MKIIILGDSHSTFFSKASAAPYFSNPRSKNVDLELCQINSASARGVCRGKDSSLVGSSINDALENNQDCEAVCFAFGQVDAEAGVYYRKYVTGSSVSFISDLVFSYESYVQSLASIAGDRQIVIKGLNPSTLRLKQIVVSYVFNTVSKDLTDDRLKDSMLNEMRRDINVLSHARINAQAANLLKEICLDYGYRYFDIRDSVEDAELPGMASMLHIRPGARDNHLVDSLGVRVEYRRGLFKSLGLE